MRNKVQFNSNKLKRMDNGSKNPNFIHTLSETNRGKDNGVSVDSMKI